MKHATFTSPDILAESLVQADYNRRRLSPSMKDPLYVHLSDIRLFLDRYTNESFESFLDYGCGGSPYRDLFKTGKYLRADYVDCGGLDYIITPEGQLPAPDNSCDCILSTQVLEHVLSPSAYLSGAFRVLRPGGKLIITTHGVWEDHGCPYDFRRWTYDGLCQELGAAGFQIKHAAKLTTGPRAIAFLLSQSLGEIHDSKFKLSGLAFRLLRRSSFGIAELRHKWMDRQFANNRVVYHDPGAHRFYLALGIEGLKPIA